MKKTNFYLTHLREGLVDANPVLVQLLGMCPTLATTDRVDKAIGMGLAATAVLIFSNFFISVLRKFIPSQVRIAAYIVIVSGFVSVVELLLNAYLPGLYESLGVFIPLIVVNCIILARAEAFASKNPPLKSLWDGLCMGLGFTFALLILATLREILGNGSFLGYAIGTPKIGFFVAAPGAFITLGCIIAAMNAIRARAGKHRKPESPAEKAMVEEENNNVA